MRVDWPTLLADAIDGGAMSSVYQPVVDVVRGKVVGYEALVRFTDPAVGNPELWFAAARRMGRAAELEAAALRSAFSARSDLPADCFLAVNVGPDVLACTPVREAWVAAGPLDGVVVELTETTRIERYADLEPDLNRLRAAGALLAIDDLGSGYAGLSHLIELRPALIKLDRGLVCGIDRDETKRALAEMIGTFAGRIDAWLLAEGIETAAELETIANLGIPLAQGFYLARPGPPWATLTDDAERTLLPKQPTAGGATLRPRLEHPPTIRSIEEIGGAFAATDWDIIVLQDAASRPIAVLNAADAVVPNITPGLRINVDTPLSAAALRALTRPGTRWSQPLLVTDNAGRYVGVVRMERILQALATLGPSQEAG